MLKKFFYGMMAATMLVATSCTDDPMVDPAGETSTVSFSISTPEIATRTFNDGTKATQLQYAVYDAQGNILDGFTTTNATINISTTVDLQLTTGNTYSILFWAAAPGTDYYTVDLTNKKMTVDYSKAISNDEARDAFFAYETFTVEGNMQKRIELRRPFAQLNIGTNDLAASETAGYKVLQSWVSVPVYSGMDLSTGEVVGNPEVKKFALANIPSGETFPVSGYDYLAMNYLLVGGIAEPELLEVEFGYTNVVGTEEANKKRKVGSVPLRRNYRTNLYGQLLTSNAKIEIEIMPIPLGEENIEIWDGKTVEEPTITATEVLVSSASEWMWLKGKAINGKTIKLTSNIDFGGYEVKGLGFRGEFDGQGYTMQNMTLLCGGSYYSNGLFQGDGSGEVTVKNLTIKDVKAECSNPDQGYVGTIFGDIQNNVTLENVHVYNADLCGVQSVGGLVGFVASGKTLTLNNCSVSDSYIHNYPVVNESGFVAGLVGRPVGTVNATNCAVNGTTVEGYYAERRGEASVAAAVGNQSPTDVVVGSDVVVKKTSMDNVVLISTPDQLNQLNVKNKIVLLTQDIDFQGAAMTKPIEMWGNSTFDGQGHKISNVVTAVQGGYATSLFRGDANDGNKVVKNLVVENLQTPVGFKYAAAIWSDLQGANIEIDNVHVFGSLIQATGTIGGFVGFVSASSTEVIIKNSSINNSNLNGGEEDHKRGALVGRAYGCQATCENVIVDNVKINGADATEATLVGDKGYTGTVTIK